MRKFTDNDKTYGPLTIGKTDWGAYRVVYSSGYDDDYPNERHNTLTVHLGKYFIGRLKLPYILRPFKKKTKYTFNPDTYFNRKGKDWYYSIYNREYGFSLSDGHLMVYYGPQTTSSNFSYSFSYLVPWLNYRLTKHHLLDDKGLVFWENLRLEDNNSYNYELLDKISICPKHTFMLEDYDGTEVLCKVYSDYKEFKLGTGNFKWVSKLTKPLKVRTLHMEFDKGIGRRKETWKGGCLSTSVIIHDCETKEDAFVRYCIDNNLTISEVLDPTVDLREV